MKIQTKQEAAGGADSQSTGRARQLRWLFILMLFVNAAARAATVEVSVGGPGGTFFTPSNLTIDPGDTVKWVWTSQGFSHSVTSGSNGTPDGVFNSGIHPDPYTFSFTFPNAGTFNYYCVPHQSMGMVGGVTVRGAAQPLNVSTRLRVQTGDRAMIGGFIITGNVAKKVIIRAIGPSLAQSNVPGPLANPAVELFSGDTSIGSNDNWKVVDGTNPPASQEATIQATGIPPSNDLESALIASLAPGGYTAVVKGVNETSGVGLVEVYDADQPAASKLANISTRGFVETGSNVMIGGFILGKGTGAARIIVRALGPSLVNAGINGVLPDPTLELHDGNGAVVRSNNNWKDSQQTEITSTGIPPPNDLESAIVETLSPGGYTAIVAGQDGATGVGLVELYQLQ